ncbi:hypothetical protein [Metabacillus sediminilitoris]|uniref:Spo0E like sporulation regulatory protein n=2 Tax=Metabacillus sediminilitoris TaxID=2567941 RepID=A0A4V3WFE9_9BACI|nr:hypothetical protein [Metabacillus sediminilitoris]QGQ44374.1 hypothetical protein GMB29_03330 [Metabacillus sediminilitoris]THF79998.1 hypothetical protein E6W99_09945 [Metabacillus sediminilitoris]
MILRGILKLSNKIDAHRQDIPTLVQNKGISHPDVITTTQKLSEEIEIMQHIIDSIQSIKNNHTRKSDNESLKQDLRNINKYR